MKYIACLAGFLAFVAIMFAFSTTHERVIFGLFNPAELTLTIALAIFLGGWCVFGDASVTRTSLAAVEKRYGADWYTSHRLVRGIGLAIGGLSSISQEMLGDETVATVKNGERKSWTANDVLRRLGLRTIVGGDTDLVHVIIKKQAEDEWLTWSTQLILVNDTTTKIFVAAVKRQTAGWQKNS